LPTRSHGIGGRADPGLFGLSDVARHRPPPRFTPVTARAGDETTRGVSRKTGGAGRSVNVPGAFNRGTSVLR